MESIEIRKVSNGFVVLVVDAESETNEFVFDTYRKVLKFIKEYLDVKG